MLRIEDDWKCMRPLSTKKKYWENRMHCTVMAHFRPKLLHLQGRWIASYTHDRLKFEDKILCAILMHFTCIPFYPSIGVFIKTNRQMGRVKIQKITKKWFEIKSQLRLKIWFKTKSKSHLKMWFQIKIKSNFDYSKGFH